MSRRILCGFCLLGPLLAQLLFAAPSAASVNLPLGDRAYRDLEKLAAFGLLDRYIYGQRPFSVSEAARLARGARRRLDALEQDPERSKALDFPAAEARRILDDLDGRLGLDEAQGPVRVAPLAWARVEYLFRDGRPTASQARIGGKFVDGRTFPLTDYAGGRPYRDGQQGLIESRHSADLTRYFSAEAHPLFYFSEDGAEAYVQTLYARFEVGPLDFEVGRDELAWGQGENGGFQISTNARPLDHFKITTVHPLHIPVAPLDRLSGKAAFFLANLGPDVSCWPAPTYSQDRCSFAYPYLAGLKISLDLADVLEVGFTGLQMSGGRGAPHYPLWDKFTDFFGFIPDTTETSNRISNRLAGFDARLRPPLGGVPLLAGAVIYGELVFDDTASTVSQLFEKDAAYSFGLYLPRLTSDARLSLRVERRRLAELVYRHSLWVEGWTLNRMFLGDPLGPNASGWFFTTEYDPAPEVRLRLEVSRQERRDESYQEDYAPPEATGPVTESRWAVKLGAEGQAAARVRVTGEIGFDPVSNSRFEEGRDEFNWIFRLGVEAEFEAFNF